MKITLRLSEYYLGTDFRKTRVIVHCRAVKSVSPCLIKRGFRHKCPEFYLLLNKWSLSACNALFLSPDLISRDTL